MIKWRIDKSNKIPLYLQLKDLAKFYISTGVLAEDERLPGVNELGRFLDVNFETVRKAYKELEKENLITMERGKGSYVSLHGSRGEEVPGAESTPDSIPRAALSSPLRLLMNRGMTRLQILRLVEETLRNIEGESVSPVVLFTECNLYQAQELSIRLADYLNIEVVPVLLDDLESHLTDRGENFKRIRAVITTGFHINEVRSLLQGRNIPVHPLITGISPLTRRAVQEYPSDTHFGFICRDRDSLGFCEDLIRTEFGPGIRLSSSILREKKTVEDILGSVDVLLVSPPVFQDVKNISPPELPVLNVFDQIDPMSLHLIKDRISADA